MEQLWNVDELLKTCAGFCAKRRLPGRRPAVESVEKFQRWTRIWAGGAGNVLKNIFVVVITPPPNSGELSRRIFATGQGAFLKATLVVGEKMQRGTGAKTAADTPRQRVEYSFLGLGRADERLKSADTLRSKTEPAKWGCSQTGELTHGDTSP